MTSSTITVIIIFSFAFIPLILAEVARKDAGTTVEDFFVYSRKMPTFYAFCTISATWFSAFAVLGSATSFYVNGPMYMTAFAWNILFAVCIFLIGRRIWHYGKKNGYITPSDFFDDIYSSPKLTVLVTCVCLLFTVPYIQIQMFGGTYLLDAATDGAIPWRMAVLIFYVIMIVYMWAGGLRSVALTDVFYTILVTFVMLFTGLFLCRKAGGMTYIFDYLIQSEKENLILSRPGSAVNVQLWLTMFIITPIGALMSPPMWIRSFSIKDQKSFYLLPFLIAVLTVSYFGSLLTGNAAKVLDPGIVDAEALLPNLIMEHGGTILATISLCGFYAAALSTANSQIHSLSAIYTIDIHRRYINPNASDARLVYITKWSLLIISMVTYLMVIRQPVLILDTGLLALSGTAQLIVPAVGGLIWNKANSNGAFVGLLSGVCVLIGLKIFGLEASLCGCIGLAVNSLLFIVIGKYGTNEPKVREKIVQYKVEFEEDYF